jgi:uncharacterized protein (DUF608 family)
VTKAKPYSTTVLKGDKSQRTFAGTDLLQIAMPLGGLGAGNVCLNGYGGLQDFSIRNRPETTAVPDGHGSRDSAFAVLHIKGVRKVTKLIEGPLPTEKIYNLGTKGQGHRGGGHEGIPRFKKCRFKGEFPFGNVILSDPAVPLKVDIVGFNPFIPLDDLNSGIPCAVLEYTFHNRSKRKVDFEFSYHLSHLAEGSGTDGRNSRNELIPGQGIHFYNTDEVESENSGSASLSVIGHRPRIKAMWFRGGWFDSISALWREVSAGAFRTNDGTDSNRKDVSGRNGGSILLANTLKPGEKVTYPVLITWHFPNCHYLAGRVNNTEIADGECCENPKPDWRPYYASKWENAREVARHVNANYASLRNRTSRFHKAFFESTLPSYVLDAISANLAILKSPTFLRQENGNAWAWEGCFVDQGCCSGSCTHVWNYAQALPHLFPQLERTYREQELERSMDRRGHINFRSALPDGETHHQYRAASDGQLGGIMKLYREWQISGDHEWLARMFPLAKKSLNYCIRSWDPRGKGVLEEPHHNTYDIEFWGPDGMCSSIYIGALSAMAHMARDLNKPEDAERFRSLSKSGAAYLDKHLYNGEFYEQKVTYRGLRDTSFSRFAKRVNRKSGEVDKLLKREGPKYQYGTGCISDGVIGAWMARIYGIESPQTRSRIRRNLKAIFQYNFKPDLSDHACTQRPGYALGNEPGLLLCSWPKGGKPTLPFVYSDEVWTGIEYQVASHLIEEGLTEEGLTIVKAARSRYDGHVRNPWNEYECGNYYARALASYALLGSLSGFRYSAAEKTLWFGPRLNKKRFKSFFSAATGFGSITLTAKSLVVELIEGKLVVERLYLHDKRVKLNSPVKVQAGKRVSIPIST